MIPISISALTTHIVALFERDELLRDVDVTGEVSTWKQAASGHIYFSLKDSGAAINAVMWRGNALSHNWLPQAGDQIIAHGHVGVYPDRGAYQLYVNRIQPAGRGQLYAQFEALKARLAEAGLFDEARKRPLVEQPRRIGVVTSADAAALRDILRVLDARWPLVEVVLFSTLVQGAEAPAQIVAALQQANRYSQSIVPIETIILARGGGSIEDLWAFNAEEVAHAIAESAIPVIVGVGHETDFTIADFVADRRAPTPSVAAALAVPDRIETLDLLASIRSRFGREAAVITGHARQRLDEVEQRRLRFHPRRRIEGERQLLADRRLRLQRAIERSMHEQRQRHQDLNQRKAMCLLHRPASLTLIRPVSHSMSTSSERSAIDRDTRPPVELPSGKKSMPPRESPVSSERPVVSMTSTSSGRARQVSVPSTANCLDRVSIRNRLRVWAACARRRVSRRVVVIWLPVSRSVRAGDGISTGASTADSVINIVNAISNSTNVNPATRREWGLRSVERTAFIPSC